MNSKPTIPDVVPKKDRFGFILVDNFHQSLTIAQGEVIARKEKEAERTKKWVKMIKHWNKYEPNRFFSFQPQIKLKRRIRKGVPDSVRSIIWFNVCGAKQWQDRYPDLSTITLDVLNTRTIDEVSTIHHDIGAHLEGNNLEI